MTSVTLTSTARSVKLIELLILLHDPEGIDGRIPQYLVATPVARVGDHLARVALNPQPLPPKERFAVAIQRGAQSIADAVIAVHLAGGDVGDLVRDVGDDLCPPPPRPPFPWPRSLPVPVPPGEPYPIDVEMVTPVVQAHVAVVLQSCADRIADERLAAHLGALADRCGDAALDVVQI
jgi:hypothetical protein